MARKTKLTPQVAELIIESVREGNFLSTAASNARIPKRTVRNWMAGGRKNKSALLREFYISVEQARAEAEINDLRIMTDSQTKDWQRYAWRLERRNWRHWGRKEAKIKPKDAPAPIKTLAEVEAEINRALAAVSSGQGNQGP